MKEKKVMMYKGDSFGELALFYNVQRQTTIKAEEDVVCLVLGREQLYKALGDQAQEVTFRNFFLQALQKDPHFNKLCKNVYQKLVEMLRIFHYKSDDTIAKKGTVQNNKILIILEGIIQRKNKPQYFRKSQVIFNMNDEAIHDEDLVCLTDCVVGEIISKSILEQFCFEKIQNLFQNSYDRVTVKVSNMNQMIEMNNDITIQDFQYIHQIA